MDARTAPASADRRLVPHARPAARSHGGAAGFSLVELLAALLLTVITILGLAHTLGLGNGFIDRFATARAALARVNGEMETVRARVRDGVELAAADSSTAVQFTPQVSGTLRTRAVPVDDPIDGVATGSADYFEVTVIAGWRQGGVDDSLRLVTLLREP